MPSQGRPRLSPEDLASRVAEYCRRYDVTPNAEGLPPFPSGRRETPQHREWLGLYKASQRLGRRARGQCQRCEAPVAEGSVFCHAHRKDGSGSRSVRIPAARRRELLEAQDGRCPVCGDALALRGAADDATTDKAGVVVPRGVLHERCRRLVVQAEALGPESVERLTAYLWPRPPAGRRR